MKKKFENIKGIISQEQMKQIFGGYVEEEEGGSSSCGFRVVLPDGDVLIECNVSRSVAEGMYNSWGGNWCCSSCPTTSYCGA